MPNAASAAARKCWKPIFPPRWPMRATARAIPRWSWNSGPRSRACAVSSSSSLRRSGRHSGSAVSTSSRSRRSPACCGARRTPLRDCSAARRAPFWKTWNPRPPRSPRPLHPDDRSPLMWDRNARLPDPPRDDAARDADPITPANERLVRAAFPAPPAPEALNVRVAAICARAARPALAEVASPWLARRARVRRALGFAAGFLAARRHPLAFAATFALLVAVVALSSRGRGVAYAAPGAGQLALLDRQGRPAGLCPLEHTDVAAAITGYVARVEVTQRFRNTATAPVEAVYTFPLPEDSAVDRMTMTIGDRVIRGAILRREEARALYDAARDAGKTASLLDQERPNIFTQSVANLMPRVPVAVTISYVHLL